MEQDRERSMDAAEEKHQAENKNSNNSQEANKPHNATRRQNEQGGGRKPEP